MPFYWRKKAPRRSGSHEQRTLLFLPYLLHYSQKGTLPFPLWPSLHKHLLLHRNHSPLPKREESPLPYVFPNVELQPWNTLLKPSSQPGFRLFQLPRPSSFPKRNTNPLFHLYLSCSPFQDDRVLFHPKVSIHHINR